MHVQRAGRPTKSRAVEVGRPGSEGVHRPGGHRKYKDTRILGFYEDATRLYLVLKASKGLP